MSPSLSPSVSPSVSISPSVSPSVSPGWEQYTKGDYAALPADDANLENTYSSQDYLDVDTNNEVRVDQTATDEYAIHQFKDYIGVVGAVSLDWEGQSDLAPSDSIVKLQVYNHDTVGWEDVDEDDETIADTDFVLTANIADTTNYKDGDGVISCRVYQLSI